MRKIITEKLYETDGTLAVFSATVLECRACDGDEPQYAVLLDRTAFFPGGGGQECDLGQLGDVAVIKMLDCKGEILHITKCPIPEGSVVEGRIDYETRLRRMQNHGGEHIVSGIVHRKYGFNNVGFHMGERDITIDFDGVLERDELVEIERLANRAVIADRKIKVLFPTKEELGQLDYRSKKELSGQVRIVEIEGFDRCACCAPHLPSTGMIGSIKILDYAHHKGGIRVHLLCGIDALEDYHRRYMAECEISALLSTPQGEVVGAVERLKTENGELRGKIGELRRRILRNMAENITPTEENICVIEEADAAGMRYFINLCTEKCRLAAFFSPDGDRRYQYIIGSSRLDLRQLSRELNLRFGGRGGGSPIMIQGSLSADENEIREFISSYKM